MDICRLHYGLYLIANSQGIVPYNAEIIRQKLFPNQSIDIESMITVLENAGLISLQGNPLNIRLIEWPNFGKCRSISKGERLQEKETLRTIPNISVKPKESQAVADNVKRRSRFRGEKNRVKSGLIGFSQAPAFQAFIKAWGPMSNHLKKIDRAEEQWKILERSNDLPDISNLLLALKTYQPGPTMWPHTWLKKKLWKKPRAKIACYTCHDEGIVYGTTPEGTKGAIPCPKCNQPS